MYIKDIEPGGPIANGDHCNFVKPLSFKFTKFTGGAVPINTFEFEVLSRTNRAKAQEANYS